MGTIELSIGDNVYVARDTRVNASAGISLADDVTIAPLIVIATMNYGIVDGRCAREKLIGKPIDIGSGAWLRAHVTVVAGSEIGDGCIVGRMLSSRVPFLAEV